MIIILKNLLSTLLGQFVHLTVVMAALSPVVLYFLSVMILFGPLSQNSVLFSAIPIIPIWIWLLYRYAIPAAWSVSWGFWVKTFRGEEIEFRDHFHLVMKSAQTMWKDLTKVKETVLR